jgi:hypothetical protein
MAFISSLIKCWFLENLDHADFEEYYMFSENSQKTSCSGRGSAQRALQKAAPGLFYQIVGKHIPFFDDGDNVHPLLSISTLCNFPTNTPFNKGRKLPQLGTSFVLMFHQLLTNFVPIAPTQHHVHVTSCSPNLI